MSDLSDLVSAVALGVLQGLTEFLPVSSSGHLVVFQQWLEAAGDDVFFDLMLHLGTLVPALWFYRADVKGVVKDVVAGQGPWLRRPGVRLALLVGIASVPTGLIGLSLADTFERLFHQPMAVSVAFACTGALLWSTRRARDGVYDVLTTPWVAALLLGLAQGVAITPGISRSGTTIAVALLLGLQREFAVKLSFLMSVPAILGAVLLKSREVDPAEMVWLPTILGTIAAAVTGYLALVWLVRLVRLGRFADFAWYVWGMAIVTMGIALAGAA